MIDLGYTGTSRGMTRAQMEAVWELVQDLDFRAHHGGCIGGDAQFDAIIRRAIGFRGAVIYPSNVPGMQMPLQRLSPGLDLICPPSLPLTRNRLMVRKVGRMIAAPKEPNMVIRSGTWTTVRNARQAGTPLAIVMPGGDVQRENGYP